VIWGLAWSPDDQLLTTGSRDESVKLWAVRAAPPLAASPGEAQPAPSPLLSQLAAPLPSLSSPVTSVSFAPSAEASVARTSYALAVGLEDGNLQVWQVSGEGGSLRGNCSWRSDQFTRHAAAVKSICWRADGQGGAPMQIATCGNDHSVRVFTCRGTP
jgi:WD40 repeat protein